MKKVSELHKERTALIGEIRATAIALLEKTEDDEYMFGDDDYTTINHEMRFTDEPARCRVVGVYLDIDIPMVQLNAIDADEYVSVELSSLDIDDQLEILDVLEDSLYKEYLAPMNGQ